jgi:hypothetical protein
MQTITDDYMRQMLPLARNYCLVILKAGPKRKEPGVEKIIWEHGRRNFALRADGVLSIVCPVVDESEVRGIGIFNASAEGTKKLWTKIRELKQRSLSTNFIPAGAFPETACRSEGLKCRCY